MEQKYCCGSDCLGCEIFAKTKLLKQKKQKKKAQRDSDEDILWSR